MIKKVLLLISIFAGISTAIKAQDQNCYKEIEPSDFRIHMDSLSNEIILDVRPFEELKSKKIIGAIIASTKDDIESIVTDLDVDTPILVYCVIGKRSAKVCESLCEKGFINLASLNGGFDKWKKEGFETIKIDE